MVIRPIGCVSILLLLAGMAAAQGAPQDVSLRPQPRPAHTETAVEPVVTPTATATPAAPRMPDAQALAPPQEPTVGPETHLPLPRYVSLKTDDANVRRGPSLSHRIDWVFTRAGMPLMITAEYGNWRRVVDREGLGGWVHYALLSGTRSVILEHDMQPLHTRPDSDAPVNVLLEAGVIARIDRCEPDWCRISSGGYRGWVPKSAIWGVNENETLD